MKRLLGGLAALLIFLVAFAIGSLAHAIPAIAEMKTKLHESWMEIVYDVTPGTVGDFINARFDGSAQRSIIAGDVRVCDTVDGCPTPSIATADGELYAEGDLEADGNMNIAGTGTITGASTLTGAVTMVAAATVGTTLGVTGALSPTGGISTSIANGANAACTTTCNTKACITGFDAGASAFVACATATADTCLCGP